MYELNSVEINSIAGGNLEATKSTPSLLGNWGFELTQTQKMGLLNLLALSTMGTLFKPETLPGKIAFIGTNFLAAVGSNILGNNLFINS